MFCAIGTPVLAIGAGRIADTGDSIGPATGRFVTIDLDDGRRARFLHLSRRTVKVGDRVTRGQVFAYSGATGYGEEDWSWNVAETGGAHVHMTLWPSHRYVFGSTGTLDPELYFDPEGSTASVGGPDERLIVNQDDKNYIDGAGQSVKDDVIKAIRADLATIHDSVLNGNQSLTDWVAAIRADLNYVHVLSPYSLKAILEASGRGQITLTADQAAAIGGQLSASVVAGLDAALRDDFDGVIKRISALPKDTVAALKSAL